MSKKVRIASLICLFCTVMVGVLTASASNGPVSGYRISVDYYYYDDSASGVDIHFLNAPSKNMVFKCGSWTYVNEPYENYNVKYGGVTHDVVFTFKTYIDLKDTDFAKGTPVQLTSYPVPAGFEAVSPPTMTRTLDDVTSSDKTVTFFIVLKRTGEIIPINKYGINVNVQTYSGTLVTWPYTGKPVCPKVTKVWTVKDRVTLTEGVDYTVSYQNNIEPGDGQVVINGKGKFNGSAVFYNRFNIFKYPVNNVSNAGSNGNASDDGNQNPQNAALAGSSINISGADYKVKKVSGKSGEAEFKNGTGLKGKVTIPSAVTQNGITYKVTSIGEKAFYKNKKVKEIVVGKNIVSIGKKAFDKCTNLKKIKIKSKVLSKVGSKCFKMIYKKAVIKVPSSRLAKYKKLLKGKGQPSGVVIKK